MSDLLFATSGTAFPACRCAHAGYGAGSKHERAPARIGAERSPKVLRPSLTWLCDCAYPVREGGGRGTRSLRQTALFSAFLGSDLLRVFPISQTLEGNDGSAQICRRGDRHVLAYIWRVRKRRYRRRVSAGRNRAARRVAGLRLDGGHHGLCDRAYFRVSSQPGRDGRTDGRRTVSPLRGCTLHRGPSRRRGCRRGMCFM